MNTITKVNVDGFDVFVSDENAQDFQNAIDTVMILLRVAGCELRCFSTTENKVEIASDGENQKIKIYITLYSNVDFIKMDCILSVPYLDLGKIRQELIDEGYESYLGKRLGGVSISFFHAKKQNKLLASRTRDLEKCMISLLRKIQIRA